MTQLKKTCRLEMFFVIEKVTESSTKKFSTCSVFLCHSKYAPLKFHTNYKHQVGINIENKS